MLKISLSKPQSLSNSFAFHQLTWRWHCFINRSGQRRTKSGAGNMGSVTCKPRFSHFFRDRSGSYKNRLQVQAHVQTMAWEIKVTSPFLPTRTQLALDEAGYQLLFSVPGRAMQCLGLRPPIERDRKRSLTGVRKPCDNFHQPARSTRKKFFLEKRSLQAEPSPFLQLTFNPKVIVERAAWRSC